MVRFNQTAQNRGLLGGRTDTGQPCVGPGRTTIEKRAQGKTRAASWSRIRLKQFSLETANAGGDDVSVTEPNNETTVRGEVVENLPGSKSVARVEGDTRNWGGPSASRYSNYENQPGKLGQPKEGEPRGLRKGVGSMSKSVGQAKSRDHAKAWTNRRSWQRKPGPVRLTGQAWPTSRLAKSACRFEEPGALIGHAGIREGGTGQPVSLPRQG